MDTASLFFKSRKRDNLSKGREMKKLKAIGIVFAVILCLGCVGMDAWWLYIYKFAPDKVTSNTFNLSDLTTASGDVKNFVEINYNRNDEKNGYEMFEIKFNYFTDEKHENFFSQGLQYVGNSKEDKLEWTYYKDKSQTKGVYLNASSGWYNGHNNYGYWGGYKTDEDKNSIYNYQSVNDYKTTLSSTNELINESKFKITLGGQNFLMGFKNRNTEMTPENFQYKQKGDYHFYLVFGKQDYNFYYSYYDVNYFSYLLYNAVKTLPAGTDETTVFEFGDIFDYYKEKEDTPNVYEEVAVDKANCPKVISDMKSYYGIKVKVSADGVQKASDSMFNCVAGNANFNLNGDYTSDTYFYGRSIIDVSIYDFDLVKIDEIYFALKLKQDFLNEYVQYKNKICLNITIDTTLQELNGLQYVGFTNDSGLENFRIYNTKIISEEVENA